MRSPLRVFASLREPNPRGGEARRAINLTLPESEVTAICSAAGISVSAIEPFISGGTRLVCTTGEGADDVQLRVRLRLADHIIDGGVDRYRFYRPPER